MRSILSTIFLGISAVLIWTYVISLLFEVGFMSALGVAFLIIVCFTGLYLGSDKVQ